MMHYDNGLETRNKILDASVSLFAEKGYENTTYADICALVHVNQGSIYYHFKKKSELFRQVYQRLNDVNFRVAQQICGENEEEYMPFLLDYYIYWYRFFTETVFRNIMSSPEAHSAPPNADGASAEYHEYWRTRCTFLRDWDSFLEEHLLDIEVCGSIDIAMSLYYRDRLHTCGFRDAARRQILYIASIFRMQPAHYEPVLQRLDEIAVGRAFGTLPALLNDTQQRV